nr:MAG: helix-turn-helix domain protein [Bacteriophage sp.]
MKERCYLVLDLVRSKVLDLNPTESILASCLFGLLTKNPIQYDGNSYYMADYKYVACYCPVLPNKLDTLRRIYKRLENIGLIETIKIDNHVYFTPSQMLRDWGTVYECVEAEKNPVEAGKNPVEAEKNPPYINNINNYNNNSIKKDAKASKENPDGFSQADFFNEEKTVKASVKFGFTPDALDVRKQVIEKVDNYFDKLVFPFDSDEFKRNFYILMCQPKWRTSQKSFSAIQANLNGLSKYPEEFALILIKESISKGWAALEYDSTPEKYEKWEKMKRSVKTEQQSSKEIADMMKYLNNDFD